MGLYCGIDLHSNNHVVTVIDEADRRLYEKRHPNELASTIGVLEGFARTVPDDEPDRIIPRDSREGT